MLSEARNVLDEDDKEAGMKTILDGLCRTSVSADAPSISETVLQTIRDCEDRMVALCSGFDAMDQMRSIDLVDKIRRKSRTTLADFRRFGRKERYQVSDSIH